MKKIAFIGLVFLLFFVSCEEDDVKSNFDNGATIEAVKEYALINQIFQDVGNNIGDGVLTAQNLSAEKLQNKTFDNSPVITVEPFDLTTFPKTTTIDFKSGVLCKDGVTRKGIISIVSSDWYREDQSVHTATFHDYYHEDYKVEGSHWVKNLGKTNEGYLRYSVRINDGKITTKTGEVISFKEDSFRTWVAGFKTPFFIWDDQYLLEGTQYGSNSKGTTFRLSIRNPLHFVLLPRDVKSGVLVLDIGNTQNIVLNYTSSTMTITGVTYPF